MTLLDRVFVMPRAPEAGAVMTGGAAGAGGPGSSAPTVAFPGPGAATSVGPGVELASTFVEQAGRRLGLVSLLMAGGMAVGMALSLFVVEVMGWSDGEVLVGRICMVGLIALSIGVYLLSRSKEITPGLLLKLGLVYEVIGALGLALPAVFVQGPPDNLLHVPWVCVWIVLFPLVVPVPPMTSLITSSIAALTQPLAIVIYVAAGHELGAKELVYTIVPPFVCVALATAAASLIHGLGLSISQAKRDLSRARSDLRSLGSYQLAELLGRGGMGEVWRAEHAMLARPAAIKLIRADRLVSATSSERGFALGRFEREARVTAALRCPHTVDLYDFGVTEDGSLYYVMELLEGADLSAILDGHGPLAPERVIHVLRQACLSLAEAHQAGLVHRDVKPANIYLCRIGLEHDFVKVLDFGLVKEEPKKPSGGEAEAPKKNAPKLTADGTLLGTFAYMAPEQIDGAERVDGRADIYSLGAVAYHLLTGRPVFEGDAPGTILFAHAKKEPVPPSERTTQRIPAELERIVLDCLAKRPGDRPASAEALAERLDACGVPEPWTSERAAAWWRDHCPSAGGSGAAVDSERPTIGY